MFHRSVLVVSGHFLLWSAVPRPLLVSSWLDIMTLLNYFCSSESQAWKEVTSFVSQINSQHLGLLSTKLSKALRIVKDKYWSYKLVGDWGGRIIEASLGSIAWLPPPPAHSGRQQQKIIWVWWCAPAVLAIPEAEVRGSLDSWSPRL